MEPTTNSVSAEVVAGLRGLGYLNALLQENYTFSDWFTANEERHAVAVAFGQTPVSYDSALIGVVRANGLRGASLVNTFRALGAPILLEIAGTQVREWVVSQSESQHFLIGTYNADEVQKLFVDRAMAWKPDEFLREKNIGEFHWHQPLSLFSGLVPELEGQIQSKLDPLLREALSATKRTYQSSTTPDPKPEALFKLVFWLLTAKVFYDRRPEL